MVEGFQELGLFHAQSGLALLEGLCHHSKVILSLRRFLFQGRLLFFPNRKVLQNLKLSDNDLGQVGQQMSDQK